MSKNSNIKYKTLTESDILIMKGWWQKFTKMFIGHSIDKKLLIVSDSQTRAQWSRYGTRIAFFFILLAGISQISLGIGMLIPCRSHIEQISCAFSLKSHPCTGLAMPSYIGCLMICIAIFGFGCVGRRASGFFISHRHGHRDLPRLLTNLLRTGSIY